MPTLQVLLLPVAALLIGLAVILAVPAWVKQVLGVAGVVAAGADLLLILTNQ